MIVPGAEGGFEVIDDEPVAGARTAVKAVRKPPPREVEPEPDEEDEPKRPTRKRKRRGLSGRIAIYWGLTFCVTELVMSLLCGIIAFVVGGILDAQGKDLGDSNVVTLIQIAVVLAHVIGFVGLLLCFATPREAEAHPQLIGCLIATLAVGGIAVMIQFVELERNTHLIVALISGVVQVVAFAMFMSYLNNLATFIGRPGTAQEATDLMSYGLLVIGATYIGLPLLAFVVVFLGCIGGLGLCGAAIAILIAWIKFLVRYFNLLQGLRSEVLNS